MTQPTEKPHLGERVTRSTLRSDGPAQGIQAVAENFQSAVQQSLKTQPLTTLGFVLVTGFVLGALWKA